jgi:pimeloyl-ACP methyl ester carboxylesterase
MRTIPIRAESGRYATPLLLLPDLWAGPESWSTMAGFLGHRGWEGDSLDLRTVPGGVDARVAAVAAHVARLPSAPVLIGHGAGALVAAGVASARLPPALVLVAPSLAGSDGVRRLAWRWDAALDLVLGRPCRPPTGTVAAGVFGELPDRIVPTLGVDDREAVLDVVRGRTTLPGALPVPCLVLAGQRDPVCPPDGAIALAERLAADVEIVPDAGHWLIAGAQWMTTANVLHRWLVRRLGAGLLELYAEAMAERDDDGE